MTTLEKLQTEYRLACDELAKANKAVADATPDEKLRLAGIWFTIAVRRARLFDSIARLTTESQS